MLFYFDRVDASGIVPASRAKLESLTRRIGADCINVERITLTGHADRLNRTGQRDYNERLAQKRARTVRDLLVAGGVDA